MLELLYMETSIKQIYVALQIDENELRVLVGEYFNTRFNIIKVEERKTTSIVDFKVVNKDLLVSDIKEILSVTSKKIGAKIEKVLLVLPAYNFKRFPLTSSVNASKGSVSKADIARAISNSLRAKVDNDVMVINPVTIKYTINGISTRRMPENETCDQMFVDIDLLCCDKEMTYSFVSAIEESGYQVLDVCLNNYAICKEASLFEESSKKNVIVLDINSDITYLTLLAKGKIVSTEIIYEGLNRMINAVYEQYHIPTETINRLLKYSVNYDEDKQDCIVYAWNQNDKAMNLTAMQLSATVERSLNDFVDRLAIMCKPILESGETSVVITGVGEQMSALLKKLSQKFEVEVTSYYPDTIGVRDSSLTAIYGSLVAYRDKVLLNNLNVSCVDLLEYDQLIDQRSIDTEGATFTTKIKKFFIQYLNREEE